MKNPERFKRILAAIGEINSSEIDRVQQAELIYATVEDAECRAAWQRVLNEKVA